MSEVPLSQCADERWYPRILEATKAYSDQSFLGEKDYREEQKRMFINGQTENPTLDYPFIDQSKLKDVETLLVELKKDVLDLEPNQVVRQAYRWALNEKIANVRRIQAGADARLHRFNMYSWFMHGRPSPDIFNYTVYSLKVSAIGAITSDDISLRNAAVELIEALPETQAFTIPPLPQQETVQRAHDQTLQEFGGMLNLPDQEVKIDAGKIKQAFDKALEFAGNNQWEVVIDDSTSLSSITIRQGERRVLIPADRTLTQKELIKLVVHEIGTHVLRRINGERSALRLLGLGLDRTGTAEEGIGVTREQAIQNEVSDFRGLDGYLAIGLALGVDGTPRDFRGVYEILEKLYDFQNIREGLKPEIAMKNAQEKAWRRCIRTFRGSDCKTPGVCARTDLSYRAGNIIIWNLIENNPDALGHFSIGKFDPTNRRHIWILEQLGILNDDLTAAP